MADPIFQPKLQESIASASEVAEKQALTPPRINQTAGTSVGDAANVVGVIGGFLSQHNARGRLEELEFQETQRQQTEQELSTRGNKLIQAHLDRVGTGMDRSKSAIMLQREIDQETTGGKRTYLNEFVANQNFDPFQIQQENQAEQSQRNRQLLDSQFGAIPEERLLLLAPKAKDEEGNTVLVPPQMWTDEQKYNAVLENSRLEAQSQISEVARERADKAVDQGELSGIADSYSVERGTWDSVIATTANNWITERSIAANSVGGSTAEVRAALDQSKQSLMGLPSAYKQMILNKHSQLSARALTVDQIRVNDAQRDAEIAKAEQLEKQLQSYDDAEIDTLAKQVEVLQLRSRKHAQENLFSLNTLREGGGSQVAGYILDSLILQGKTRGLQAAVGEEVSSFASSFDSEDQLMEDLNLTSGAFRQGKRLADLPTEQRNRLGPVWYDGISKSIFAGAANDLQPGQQANVVSQLSQVLDAAADNKLNAINATQLLNSDQFTEFKASLPEDLSSTLDIYVNKYNEDALLDGRNGFVKQMNDFEGTGIGFSYDADTNQFKADVSGRAYTFAGGAAINPDISKAHRLVEQANKSLSNLVKSKDSDPSFKGISDEEVAGWVVGQAPTSNIPITGTLKTPSNLVSVAKQRGVSVESETQRVSNLKQARDTQRKAAQATQQMALVREMLSIDPNATEEEILAALQKLQGGQQGASNESKESEE